ncbi:hypothetical protein E3T47_05340 [Cryobacterium ruanii]|uniref:Winged helix DNA-binding domain-containing protein n=1 Tax=Cryobacterium ruanii TaxID=1259197 RepID=A0A4R9AQK7_9MICO|nr:hypothetical protein E3T47_05340 [Cryobacterium ruanii]
MDAELGRDRVRCPHRRRPRLAGQPSVATLRAAGLSTEGQRGYHTIAHLALTGTLCWGRQVGTQQGLVLVDKWVLNPRRLERDDALGEFVYRYFRGHGPATLVDFAWWSQLTVADAKIGLAVARSRLTEVRVDCAAYFLAAETADAALVPTRPRQRTPVLALPGFDEYLLGYRDRSFVISGVDIVRVAPGLNGIFLPLVVTNGRIVGTWRKKTTASGVTDEAALFEDPTTAAARTRAGKARRGFDRAVQDYARFVGVPYRQTEKPAAPASV